MEANDLRQRPLRIVRSEARDPSERQLVDRQRDRLSRVLGREELVSEGSCPLFVRPARRVFHLTYTSHPQPPLCADHPAVCLRRLTRTIAIGTSTTAVTPTSRDAYCPPVTGRSFGRLRGETAKRAKGEARTTGSRALNSKRDWLAAMSVCSCRTKRCSDTAGSTEPSRRPIVSGTASTAAIEEE